MRLEFLAGTLDLVPPFFHTSQPLCRSSIKNGVLLLKLDLSVMYTTTVPFFPSPPLPPLSVSSCSSPATSPSPHPLLVLDVYVLSTDGQMQDFRFPQTSKVGASIQLSANTVKVNSKNGNKGGKKCMNKMNECDHTEGALPCTVTVAEV